MLRFRSNFKSDLKKQESALFRIKTFRTFLKEGAIRTQIIICVAGLSSTKLVLNIFFVYDNIMIYLK